MKRLSVAAATIAALVLASAPALADDNKGKGEGHKKQTAIEINGTVASVVDTSTVTVLVKAASQPKALKSLTKTFKDATITVKSDTNTVVKRGGTVTTLGALTVGDKVNLRATCVAGTPVVCVASRVTAVAVKLHLGLGVRGVVVSNAAGVLGVVVTSADAGDDNTFKERAILGTTFTFQTDTATVVTKAGAAVTVASLTGFPAVNVQATCTAATPAVCTAKRITVIVPTA
jgi:hypothetical protein